MHRPNTMSGNRLVSSVDREFTSAIERDQFER